MDHTTDVILCYQSPPRASHDDGDGNKPSRVSQSSVPNDSTYINYQEEDFDETFISTGRGSGAATQNSHMDDASTGYGSSGRNYPMKCTALYDFQVDNTGFFVIKLGIT